MLLNCHTYYSFCYGTLSIDALFAEVKNAGHSRFVLSDINCTSAILDAIRLAPANGLQVVPGIDFRNGIEKKYIGIARNNAGYNELNIHLSKHLHSALPFENEAPEFSHAYIIYPFANFQYRPLLENEFVGITLQELKQLPFSRWRQSMHKIVLLHSVSFANKLQFNAHRLLRAIDKNMLLSMLPESETATAAETILPRETIELSLSAYPEILRNTERILDDCSVQFTYGKLSNKNLSAYLSSEKEDLDFLRSKCLENIPYRFPNASKVVYERLEKELEVIAQKQFASYYLINYDITNYARHKGYYYVGRGSGANSLAAYLLRITDVDPIELDLYFERFINIHRANAPDFDIDFSWTDRDDITDYIFKTFEKDKSGKERHNVALLGSYSTFQKDAITRELGKVFGLPPGEIDKLQKNKDATNADHIGKLILKYGSVLHGFPSHLSIHASGIIISQEPVTAYGATFLPPKGFPTTQFSMLEAEDIGLFKFDILSQRGLGKIKDSIALVKQNKNIEVDIHDVKKFIADESVKDLLRQGKCIGCFYIESPAMRMLLAKLQADDYLRLVAASSIIRPGVSKSGMMREYILRYRDENKRKAAEEALPELYDILRETYGVMVYQEDVIKIAHIFAGLSLADADYLRRGMSWKFKQRGEFHKVKENFFNNCYIKGYSENTIQNIWTQIESFANFAFSKGHSASYAVESYQALFLKTYYPLEYMVATLNNGGGFYRTEIYVHEARMHGAKIFAPCVNKSDKLCTIFDKNVFIGFSFVRELELQSEEALIAERKRNGEYKDLYDFVQRVKLSVEQLRLLIRVGAFAFTGKNKKELLWEVHMLVNPLKKEVEGPELFEVKPHVFKLPPLESSWLTDAFDEIELLGFSLTSPFHLLKEKSQSSLLAKDLKAFIGKTVEIVGYLVTIKNTYTSSGERMYFGTFLDMNGAWIDTVHFPPSVKAYPVNSPGCYRLIGKVVEEFDFINLEIGHAYRLNTKNVEDEGDLKEKEAFQLPL